MMLLLAVILSLTTGCGGNSTSLPAPASPNADFFKIAIAKVDTTQLSPTYSTYNNTWSAVIGENKTGISLNFFRKLIGTTPLRGGPGWNFSIFTSKVATDSSDPTKDIANFNIKVIDLPASGNQDYLFLGQCRVLIKAYDTITKKEVDSCFLEVRVNTPANIPNLQIGMTVVNGANSAGEARQIATIVVRNVGTATAQGVIVKLGPNYDFANAIESSVSWDYSTTSSGPKILDPNVIYELGKTVVTNNGDVNAPNIDSLVTSGLQLEPIAPAEAVSIRAYYKVDPNAQEKGMTRKAK